MNLDILTGRTRPPAGWTGGYKRPAILRSCPRWLIRLFVDADGQIKVQPFDGRNWPDRRSTIYAVSDLGLPDDATVEDVIASVDARWPWGAEEVAP